MVRDHITDGTWVRARPFGYDERRSDYAPMDVDPPELAGVPEWLEGPLETRTSTLGHTVYVVAGIVVEPESIRISRQGSRTEDGPRRPHGK